MPIIGEQSAQSCHVLGFAADIGVRSSNYLGTLGTFTSTVVVLALSILRHLLRFGFLTLAAALLAACGGNTVAPDPSTAPWH